MIAYTIRSGDLLSWPAEAAAAVRDGFCPYCRVKLQMLFLAICPCCDTAWSVWESGVGTELRQDGACTCEHSPIRELT